MNLQSATLHIQADNCSKEIENNSVMRLAAMWVALGHIQSCVLTFLSSGHSHEDTDGRWDVFFGAEPPRTASRIGNAGAFSPMCPRFFLLIKGAGLMSKAVLSICSPNTEIGHSTTL